MIKDDDDGLHTICGSPGYVGKNIKNVNSVICLHEKQIAPEVLLKKAYSFPVDIWAIG